MTRSFLPLVATVLAASSHVTNAAVSSSSICTSAAFQALQGTRLGSGPVFMRALVQGDEVCIEYQLDASVASSATWFAAGPSRASLMVSSPPADVMFFSKSAGQPVSYTLGGYSSSLVTESTDQTVFKVGASNADNMSFSFQRTLAAGSATEVALSATGTSNFVWAYGTSWPISGHKSGTNGAATFNFAAAPGTASTSVGASTQWCDDKNCPAIVGGIAFAIMAVCGLVLTVVLKASPVGKLLLHKTVSPPPTKITTNSPVGKPHTVLMQTLADLHLGELLVILIFVAAVIVLISLLDHKKKYIVSGQVALMTLMFLILPVSRLPLWSILFGSSFERIIKFHRWLGLVLCVVLIIHILQATDVVKATLSTKYNTVTPLYGLISFIAICTMVVFSLDFIRRMMFEVFYLTHRVLSIVAFVFAILHSPKIIGRALSVPLVLYGLGLLYRWSSAFTGSYKATATVRSSSNSTTLLLEPTAKTGKMAMTVNPGSYYFVRFPAVSAIQWHPFSSIVTPDGKSLGFCIKAMGNGSFTRQLLEKAGNTYNFQANLCGPFGKMSLDVERYDAVLLIAGGVGITPLMSLINQTRLFPKSSGSSTSAKKTADWFVQWSVREPEDILMMEEFLPTQAQLDFTATNNVQDPNMAVLGNSPSPVNINWMFHVSSARSDGVVTRANGETLSYRGGKPILDELINTSRFNGRKVTVVACGPPTMTVEAQSLARSCSFDFHKEVFNW